MSARDTGVAPAQAEYTAGRMARTWPQVRCRVDRRADGSAAVRVLAVRIADGGVAA
ncbi:hypothetical protein [Nonomuraea sp. NPDC049625]|uniref:hypothetical protein n=1 Tax=Nonomuraea sp. NPDC049625 TaxID=3155775 RepID=UPI00344A54D7